MLTKTEYDLILVIKFLKSISLSILTIVRKYNKEDI
jgi:hypothetical protein